MLDLRSELDLRKMAAPRTVPEYRARCALMAAWPFSLALYLALLSASFSWAVALPFTYS